MKMFLTLVLLIAMVSCNEKVKKDMPENAQESVEDAPPPLQGDPSNNPDMVDFAAQVDTNGDGKMSKEEWDAQGLPSTSFNGFEKGRGYVTLEDYQKNPAPEGIDINGDGKLTVEEFKEFDKIMSEKMKSGEMPPPPNGQ